MAYIYEDTIKCLKEINCKGYENIIVSKHVPELKDLVEGFGLNEYFTKVYSSAYIGFEKPNIEIL